MKKLHDEEVEERLGEFVNLHPIPCSSELEMLETALFIEETFDIRLSDAEIAPAFIGSHDSLLRLIVDKGRSG